MRFRLGAVALGLAVVVAVPYALRSMGPHMTLGDIKAYPIAGAENHILVAGMVGSDRGMTLVGADTPYGHAELAATSGCTGSHEPLPQWRIESHGSIDFVLGSRYLAVWAPSGLPGEGSEMPLTLHFSDAADVVVTARVQSVDPDGPWVDSGGSACSS